MDINGCHVVSNLNAKGAEGFETHVTRTRMLVKEVDGKPVSSEETSIRGPFFRIKDAVDYAHAWNDFNNAPPMQVYGDPDSVMQQESLNAVADNTEAPDKVAENS